MIPDTEENFYDLHKLKYFYRKKCQQEPLKGWEALLTVKIY